MTADILLERAEAVPGANDENRAARWGVSLLFLVNGTLLATWVSRIPAIESARGLNHGAFGLALLIVALGAVISMPLAGALSARWGTDRICRISSLTYCLATPLLAIAPGWLGWGMGLFVFGAGHGALDVSMNAQAVAIEKLYRRPIMSSFHALFSAGGLLGAVLGGLLAAIGLGPAAHFGLVAGLSSVALAAVFPRLLPERSRREGKTMAAITFRLPPFSLLALGVVALCSMVGEGAMADWSAVYLRTTLGTGEGLAAAGYAAFSVTMAGGRFFGDRIVARFGAVNLVRNGGSLAVVGMVCVLFGQHPVFALLGFALVGAGLSNIVPLVFSAAGRTPGMSPAMAVACVTTLGYFGFLAAPPFIGGMAQMFSLREALELIVLTSLSIVVLAPSVSRRREEKSYRAGGKCL